MIIIPRDDISIESVFPADAAPRSEGLHLSSIYGAIMQELEPEKYGGPMDWNRVMTGVAFERSLEQALAGMHQSQYPGITRPGEFWLDGVVGTPDGLDTMADPPRLYEYKCTWKSGRYPLSDRRFLAWLMQMKGYLHMMRLQHATLIALFVNGDYEKGKFGQPYLRAFDLEFSLQELRDNWIMLLNTARRKGWL